MPDEKLPLILHPSSGLARVGLQGGRIVAEMVDGALALSRAAKKAKKPSIEQLSALAAAHLAKMAQTQPTAAATVKPTVPILLFKIGEHEFYESDYRQILLWAGALEMEAETVIERLLKKPEKDEDKAKGTQFSNGRIVQLGWDMGFLPLVAFE
jgi:hypothetical protein